MMAAFSLESASAMPYQIIPLPADFLARVRAGHDDQGQPVEFSIAEGGEPLRDVLRRARPGEPIALASYCPFQAAGPYREFGPVFVGATAAPETVAFDSLPLPPARDYFSSTFVLRAYSGAERIVDAVLVAPGQAEEAIARFLGRPEVAFILARFAAYGCYACRIERVSARPGS
jgi:hypothetical protein